MASSKRSEKEIKDKRSQRFEYVGDKKVANELQEIEFQPSSLETIDRAMLRFIDEDLNLFTTTNDGFKKVPVLWVTAERAFQIKHNKDLRDKEETLILPLITVNRVNVTKEQNYRGTVFANLYPVNHAKGGTITVAVAREDQILCLTISDTGSGLPREAVERINQRGSTTVREGAFSGHGLGLTIVSDLIARHGGTVAISSKPNRGTAVVCRLPAA